MIVEPGEPCAICQGPCRWTPRFCEAAPMLVELAHLRAMTRAMEPR